MGALTSNEYCMVGRAFLKTINLLVKEKESSDKCALFNTLDKIKLKEGFCLGLHLAQNTGIGDESWFYTYPEGKKTTSQNDVLPPSLREGNAKVEFIDLTVEPSAMGAWQAYLYLIAPTVMPVFWHGGYICRDNLFSLAAFNRIVGSRTHGIPSIIKGMDKITEEDVLPSVSYENGKAIVSSCYWTDWGGLIRETVVIDFNGETITSVSKGRKKTLVKFDCGICF